jgi:4-aminobutyrate aminotransferase-like enzyme
MNPEEILRLRERYLGRALSFAYQEPLKIVRGEGQYLFDDEGRAYLDCVNNVCHIGHCHPRVVDAAAGQMAILNTNTRYLHDHLVEYARRLTETMPGALEVCFFVCSGSEANELALRLARSATGRRDVIVVESAYHGNTTGLIEISPYKFDGPGGEGRPAHVRVAAMPDGYRGTYRYGDAEIATKYAAAVADEIAGVRADGREIAAFFCESMLGCAGQIVLPDGYLHEAYGHVRKAGGVCVADEVQVGFGRVGSNFWAFETQGVVPDIVTLGKPIGNGHPIGAVVTTRSLAEAADTGMEYFNTFGGNPVSCAVALAVLDVIEEEGLQAHAAEVGAHLKSSLMSLAKRHPVIGDVRGLGLFLGIELVREPESLTPATRGAAEAIELMKGRGVLLSTDGPFANVLKIKPPLVFSRENADELVAGLDEVLGEVEQGAEM